MALSVKGNLLAFAANGLPFGTVKVDIGGKLEVYGLAVTQHCAYFEECIYVVEDIRIVRCAFAFLVGEKHLEQYVCSLVLKHLVSRAAFYLVCYKGEDVDFFGYATGTFQGD